MSPRRGLSHHDHDRNRGAGLPSVIGDETYQRLANVLARRTQRPDEGQARTARRAPTPAPRTPSVEMRRFARLEDVGAAGFVRVAQGLYRGAALDKSAHPVWELRGAEDGEGFVLVRKREERAVDLRATAGIGTAAALEVGVMARTARGRRTAAEKFMVSLLQTPGGDIKQRKTIMPERSMDVEDLERLVDELQLGPTRHNFDTWSDGEWELRVRGPGGQLIHDYEAIGPDEIGGERGRALLQTINSVLPVEEDDMAEGEGMAPPLPGGEEGGLLGGGEDELDLEAPTETDMEPAAPAELPPPGGAPGEAAAPPPAAGGMVPPAGPLAPSASRLKRGRRIAIIRQGQVADAIVVLVRPEEHALDVVLDKSFGAGGGAAGGAGMQLGEVPFPDAQMEGGVVETIPMIDVVDIGDDGDEAEIEIEADEADPFEVDIAPASEEEAYDDGQGGEVVETPAPFQPGGEGESVGEGGGEGDFGSAGDADNFGSDEEAFSDAFY